MKRGALFGMLALGALGLAAASSSGPSSSSTPRPPPPGAVDYLKPPPGGIIYPPHGPGVKVAAVRTTYTASDVETLMRGAWPVAVPGWGGLSSNLLGFLLIQSAAETNGWASCWNNNLGNVTAYDHDRPYFEKRSKEYDAENNPYWKIVPYRSYDAPELGAWDMIAVLATRYRAALAAAARGDLDAYAAALKSRGYFSATAPAYAAILRRWQSELGWEFEGGRAVA